MHESPQCLTSSRVVSQRLMETLLMNPADSQAYLICISFRNSSNLWWWIRGPSPAAWTFVLGVCTKESTPCGSNFWDNLHLRDWFLHAQVRLTRYQLSQFFTALRYCSEETETICWMNCAKQELCIRRFRIELNRTYSTSPCENPRFNELVARITGYPLSLKLSTVTSAVVLHFPSGLSLCVPYNFSSSLGPRNDQCPSWNLPA